jgi:hypothetical protein
MTICRAPAAAKTLRAQAEQEALLPHLGALVCEYFSRWNAYSLNGTAGRNGSYKVVVGLIVHADEFRLEGRFRYYHRQPSLLSLDSDRSCLS